MACDLQIGGRAMCAIDPRLYGRSPVTVRAHALLPPRLGIRTRRLDHDGCDSDRRRYWGSSVTGWLSGAEATAGAALTVQYPRFCRAHTPTLSSVSSGSRGQQEAGLWIARSYLDRFEIEEIRPAPVAVSRRARPHLLHVSERSSRQSVSAVRFTLEARARRSCSSAASAPTRSSRSKSGSWCSLDRRH